VAVPLVSFERTRLVSECKLRLWNNWNLVMIREARCGLAYISSLITSKDQMQSDVRAYARKGIGAACKQTSVSLKINAVALRSVYTQAAQILCMYSGSACLQAVSRIKIEHADWWILAILCDVHVKGDPKMQARDYPSCVWLCTYFKCFWSKVNDA